MRVLHLSPHPDDELLGSPAALMSLAAAGHEITNLAVSLGRPDERARREQELREACARAGFSLVLCSPVHEIGLHDDRSAAQARLTSEVVTLAAQGGFELLIAPSPHDGHHGHEVVGRSAVAAAEATSLPLWMWSLWSTLAAPTLLHTFTEPMLDRILVALDAHASQLERNDFRETLRARTRLIAGLGPERVFGFGGHGIDASFAEELCEAVPVSEAPKTRAMLLGSPRRLDPAAPLAPPTDMDIRAWLRSPSPRDEIGRSAHLQTRTPGPQS
jgi:LmbE family N-acetylglucosaminyl deacetylase